MTAGWQGIQLKKQFLKSVYLNSWVLNSEKIIKLEIKGQKQKN